MASKKAAPKKAAPKRKYVVVRTTGAGVHAGELVSRKGTEVTLAHARRIWFNGRLAAELRRAEGGARG